MEFRMTEINLILINGKITTLDPQNPEVQAIAIADGKVVRTGTNDEGYGGIPNRQRSLLVESGA